MDSASLGETYQNGDGTDPFRTTRDQFSTDRYGETRGTANPSIMDKPFWKYMVATESDAYRARKLFAEGNLEEDFNDKPVWCFSRFDSTTTKLLDGRHVHIGGEHEDFYDPNFCIYNNVVVIACNPEEDIVVDNRLLKFPHNPQPTSPKSITIYGYPVDVFPPTDFHTATYFRDSISCKEFIFVVGGLGYADGASRDRMDVYRLDLSDFSMQLLEMTGEKPARATEGHQAQLVDDGYGADAAIKITTEGGQAFSLLIDKMEWISHGQLMGNLIGPEFTVWREAKNPQN